MHIRKLDAQLPASRSPQSSRPTVPQQAVAPEHVSAATRRVLPSEHHRGSRHTPYQIPARGPRAAENNTADQPRLPVTSSHIPIAPNGHGVALGHPGDRIRLPVSGQDLAAPESRNTPHPVPVAGSRAAAINTANQSRLPVTRNMWQDPGHYHDATERHNYDALLSEARQVLGSGHNPQARPIRGPLPDVGQLPVALHYVTRGRLAGRVSFAPNPHNAGPVPVQLPAPGNRPARRLLPGAPGNIPIPIRLPVPPVPERRRLHPRIEAPERDHQDPEDVPVPDWTERYAIQEGIYGLVCEIDEEQVKLYDFRERRMRTIQNNFEVPPRLHDYIRANGDAFIPLDYKWNHKGVKDISATGHIHTWATSPNAEEISQMSESTRAKFEGKIWSPYLAYLSDPDHLYNPTFAGKEVWICAKYAPSENSYFQIVKVYEERNEDERFAGTPWVNEVNGVMDFDEDDEEEFAIPRGPIGRVHYGGVVKHAVCIATDVFNPSYSALKDGSTPRCQVFFSRMYGIYRCVKPAVLGQWYSHNSYDDRKKEEYRHLSLYRAVTVGLMETVDAPVWTEVDNDVVYMKVEFGIKSLKTFDCLWNKFVGKVELTPTDCQSILDPIQQHLGSVRPEERALYEDLLKRGIFIRAKICTRPAGHHADAENYPTTGAFVFYKVLLIKYKESDDVIFQQAE